MWNVPYIMKHVLHQCSYEIVDYDVIPLKEAENGFYLKNYYS
jgi:hypothetical protein